MSDRQPRIFEITPAKRTALWLSVGIFGPSGSGKTYSAHRLASGIASVVGGPVGGLDTENRRMSHYADRFTFQCIDMQPPFDPLSYSDAAWALARAGCKTIVVDSGSHEYDHVNLWHDSELTRLAGDDEGKRKRCNFSAWIEPKKARKAMINEFLRIPAHVIWCFRAGKELDLSNPQRPTDKGWQPKTSDDLIYEMTATGLLLPGAKGVPTWNPETLAERQMVKNPEQFASLFKRFEGKPFCEEMGAEMARWAMGDSKPETPPIDHAARLLALISAATTHAEIDAVGNEMVTFAKSNQLTRAQQDKIKASGQAKRATLSEGA